MSRRELPHSEIDNVPHPRYRPVSGRDGKTVAPVEAYWRYGLKQIYPKSAIPADTRRQNYCVFPQERYVDIQKQCRDCNRPFIFFAREQKYWYETLGYYIDADCVRCPECRKDDRFSKKQRKVFSQHIANPPTDFRSLIALLEAGVFLWGIGELKNEHTLRRLKNLAHAEAKTHPIRETLDALVDSVSEK